MRFKPIASEASPHVLPQPLRTTHGHRSLTRAHRDVRVDITAKRRPGRAGSCVPRRRVSRLGVSRVLGAFSRLLARSRIGGLNRRVIVLRLEQGSAGRKSKAPPKLGPEAPTLPRSPVSPARVSKSRSGFPRGKIEPPAIGAFHSDLAPPSARGGPASVISASRIADFFEISEVRGPASEAAASEARRAR